MLSLMLQRITALEGDAAAEEEEQSKNALIETYIGESISTTRTFRINAE